ncbi:uncharacterized protein LTR77_002541 [Saxophila tyrrhenica]|uniref:DUF1295-domain-containing protein n=1 Tax=Saxophila tyrrhenica TaxID=1690608 RepID=A0AAV9PLZ2_9PEZI|nr:hypothetical protein LTR77_002541 [Saxophila tyrrhenica]
MALPVITSLADCADFSKTVEPYIPQLYAFPSNFANAITNPEALKHLYLTTNPIISGLAFSIATFPIFFIVAEINKNYSQVDRVWSILPTIYHIHYAVWARLNGMPTQLVDNVLAFSVVWSTRLTFNYWRRGGYQVGSEDYRWKIIQDKIGSFAFVILNVLFISTAQIILLQAVTTPTYLLLLTSRLHPTLSTPDALFARSLLLLVVVEYFADQQQWNYHAAKAQYASTAKVPQGWTRAQMDRGFNTTGLWKFSRHPNFAAEQMIWVTLYAWGAWRTGSYVNWTAAGVVGYLGVFAGSTPITERISKGKYPEYEVYQRRVGKFLPLGLGWTEEAEEEGKRVGEKRGKKKQ